MYSYEDRMRAVALYIKLGKRPKATIRQLGYPSKNALKDWYLEYEHDLDLRLGFAPRAPGSHRRRKKWLLSTTARMVVVFLQRCALWAIQVVQH